MPTVPYKTQRRVDRLRDQRWLLDKVIETVGPEFDQSRLQYYSAPMSPDHRGPVMGLKALIHRSGSRSSQLGSPFFPMIADWLADRAKGKPLQSTYNVVDTTGQMHSEPWGEDRIYQYGAPLGVDQLFADKPPVGLA